MRLCQEFGSSVTVTSAESSGSVIYLYKQKRLKQVTVLVALLDGITKL